MRVEISYRDENGVPLRVNTNNGFCQTSRPYNPDEDGWIDQQLNEDMFPAIQTGRQMELLVNLVNKLKRENFQLKNQLNSWQKASGMFGA